ncbi:MAG: MoaD/ThiS family protein [Hyphomicrobiales bacterium]|nr:MoaD/ThiS family protein [Hyphomicrobiales bacterium]MCP5374259.1 MoaD/ThiS family protein [Hyphomicrobiales bacterium]
MKVTVKLYAMLGQYLPAGAKDNTVTLDAEADATPASLVARLGVPAEQCHLVLVNGVYVAPSERGARALADGDTLAIWPPVAGG